MPRVLKKAETDSAVPRARPPVAPHTDTPRAEPAPVRYSNAIKRPKTLDCIAHPARALTAAMLPLQHCHTEWRLRSSLTDVPPGRLFMTGRCSPSHPPSSRHTGSQACSPSGGSGGSGGSSGTPSAAASIRLNGSRASSRLCSSRGGSSSSSSRSSSSSAEGAMTAWVEQALGTSVQAVVQRGRSDWARSLEVRLQGGRRLFVKLAQGSGSAMFEGEARGLQALAEGGALRVPQVLHWGPLPGLPGQAAASFIVMEHLELEEEGPGSAVHQAQLGRQLAAMHMALPKLGVVGVVVGAVQDAEAAAGRFGFPIDNTIGGTAQPNAWTEDWVEFFREQRLAHMLRLLGDSRLSQLGPQLLPRLDHFFRDITVRPSVLHGDLWSGNIGRADGQPVVFDPATYYGHHEAEFGMSWCAGGVLPACWPADPDPCLPLPLAPPGFTTAFWDAYWAVLPKQPGWEERHQLYTLYHILNHAGAQGQRGAEAGGAEQGCCSVMGAVLFGGGYAAQAQALMRSLIAKLPA
ncbi:hypothetical protein QJQ45_028992 [Haematococcus lacustris]|nr:hypothetical protein QJQ45_028992 [Haematococcus lacustris]